MSGRPDVIRIAVRIGFSLAMTVIVATGALCLIVCVAGSG
jgi:hypothetical protein